MQGRMADGQVYVALSRVPSLTGLFLLDFDVKKLKASSKVNRELSRTKTDSILKTYHNEVKDSLDAVPKPLLVAVHNTRSLPAHHKDLLLQPLLSSCTAVCLTETWPSPSCTSSTFAIPGYILLRQDRQGPPAGGVCTHVSASVPCQEEQLTQVLPGPEMQCVVLHLPNNVQLFVVTVYRHQNQLLSELQKAFRKLLRHFSDGNKSAVIVGYLNINLFQERHSAATHDVAEYGFKQHVQTATHASGSLLDHVYSNVDLKVWKAASYYTDHDMLWLSIVV